MGSLYPAIEDRPQECIPADRVLLGVSWEGQVY